MLFALGTLKDPRLAWEQAARLRADDDHTWTEVAKAYEPIDALAELPIHRRLVEHELANAGAQHYRLAARRRGCAIWLPAPTKPTSSTRSSLGCARITGGVQASAGVRPSTTALSDSTPP